jgi:hypothetical protein
MTKKKVPKKLWDFGLLYESELLSRMACRDEVHGALLGINPKRPDDIFLEEHNDEFEPAEPGAATMPEADNYTPEAYDGYLAAEVLLPTNMGENNEG